MLETFCFCFDIFKRNEKKKKGRSFFLERIQHQKNTTILHRYRTIYKNSSPSFG